MTARSPTEHAELRAEIERQRNLMIAVATSGPPIDDVDWQYTKRRSRIAAELEELGLDDPNPHRDLWDWADQWRSYLPTYQSRRDYVRDLYEPLLTRLASDTERACGPLPEPTGWLRVDRTQDKMRQAVAWAKHEEDWQQVGLLGRETLISLAQAVYTRERHPPTDGTEPSATDAGRMLESYIAAELQGGSNEEARAFVRSSLKLALSLQHRRTATFRDAALCYEATASVVRSIAIVSGRRDPEP